MSSPSVAVRVLGDSSNLNSEFKKTGDAAESSSGRIQGAFHSALGAINATGVLGPFGAVLDQIDQGFSKVAESGKKLGPALLGVGATAIGIGTALTAVGDKDKAAQQQLVAAVEATGKSYDQFGGKVDEAVKKQEKYGHTADETKRALQVLTQATGDPAKALEYLSTASDLAAAKHEDLTAAAGQLGKAYNGAGKILKEFGVDAAPKAAAATKGLETATKQAQSADEAAAKAKQNLADLQERVAAGGAKTGAALVSQNQQLQKAQDAVSASTQKAADAHAKLSTAHDIAAKAASGQGDTMDALSKKLSGQASAATDTFTGKLKGLKAVVEDQVAQFGEKYGPAIQVTGVALTGLGAAIEIAGNSTKIFTGIQAAFNVVMDANPIILVVLALALLALGVYEAYKHIDVFREAVDAMGRVVVVVFDAIVGAGKAVFGWIVANWPLLLGILAGPFGLAAALIYKYWDDIFAFFKAVPPRLASIFTGMWDGIWTSFKAVLNFIIDAWNKLQFQTPSIDILGVHTPSVNIGVPKIPRLEDGGAIIRTGLALVHAGETVVPAGVDRGGGPSVVIENATFESDTDIEVFMRQAAWAAQTAGL